MAERASLFEDSGEFDIAGFTPKKPAGAGEPPSEAVRAVSESVNFQSREPVKATVKAKQRRRRTGRNQQFNVKLSRQTIDSIYQITDRQGWSCLGETLERAVAALQKELAVKS